MEVDVGQSMIAGDPEHVIRSILLSHDYMTHHCKLRFVNLAGTQYTKLRMIVSMSMHVSDPLISYTVISDIVSGKISSEGKFVNGPGGTTSHYTRIAGGGWTVSDWMDNAMSVLDCVSKEDGGDV